MDQLLNRLEKSGLGCHIGAYYYGAFGYADDLTLLIPTVNGLQKMVNICEQYSNEYGVKYNPIKTVAMHLSQKKQADPPQIDVAGTKIKWMRMAKHLGNYIRSDMKNSDDIQHKRGDFIGRINNLIVNFGTCRHMLKQNIFNSQCSHFYGCES